MAKEENFYHELDKHKKKRSYCTCQTLAMAMFIFIVVVVVILILMIRQISIAVAPQRKVVGTQTGTTELQQKFEDLSKAPGASTSITVTEQELTSLLMSGIEKQPNIPIRDVQAEIDPDQIRLTATSTQIIQTSLAISVVPKVDNGKLGLELVKIQAGSLPVPAVLTQKISDSLNQMLSEQMSQIQGVNVKSIQLLQGKMAITGTISSSSPTPEGSPAS